MPTDSFDTINYEVDGHTATITLNRPDALNALSPHMINELRTAYDEAENDDKIWLLVVTGTGRAFCTGADVKAIPGDGKVIYERPYLSTYDQWEAPQEGTPPFRRMAKPVLTAVNGLCCGAGLDWVTTSDIVIASERATFFDPHVSIDDTDRLCDVFHGRLQELAAEAQLLRGLVEELGHLIEVETLAPERVSQHDPRGRGAYGACDDSLEVLQQAAIGEIRGPRQTLARLCCVFDQRLPRGRRADHARRHGLQIADRSGDGRQTCRRALWSDEGARGETLLQGYALT